MNDPIVTKLDRLIAWVAADAFVALAEGRAGLSVRRLVQVEILAIARRCIAGDRATEPTADEPSGETGSVVPAGAGDGQ